MERYGLVSLVFFAVKVFVDPEISFSMALESFVIVPSTFSCCMLVWLLLLAILLKKYGVHFSFFSTYSALDLKITDLASASAILASPFLASCISFIVWSFSLFRIVFSLFFPSAFIFACSLP